MLLALTRFLAWGGYCFSWQYPNLRQQTFSIKHYDKHYKVYAEDTLTEAIYKAGVLSLTPETGTGFQVIPSKFLL